MNKKILLFIMLFISIISFKGVNAKVADVSIKNIEMIEKTGQTEIVNDATFNGMNINYNIMFKEINDSIKYKITLINKGNDDIYINNKGEIGGSNYIVYDYIWDDNQNVIKGNTEKTFELNITYKKQVEGTTFEKGTYVEAKDLVIKISDQKGNTLPARNPKTDSNLSIFIILLSIEILAVMAVTIYLIKNKKLNIKNLKQMKKTNMVTAGVFLILVLGTIIGYSYALDATEIVLNSTVKVSKARLARSCSSDSYAIDHPYDNSKTMYEERGDNFPFVDEGKVIETGIDSNDYCLDWTIEIEKAMNSRPKLKAANNMLNVNNEEENMILEMVDNSMSLLSLDEESIPTMLSENNISTYELNNLSNDEEVNYYAAIATTDTKDLPSTYNYDNKSYELIYESDVSDLQNGEVMLGYYEAENNVLLLIGEDGGVLAPVDSSWMFGFLDRKNILTENQLNILQGLGRDLDEIQNLTSEDQSENINEIIDIKRIIQKPKLQMLFNKNIQIGPMISLNDFYLDKIDFSDTNNMSGMFAGSGILADGWRLRGLENWDTSNVKDMSGMFIAVGIKDLIMNSGSSEIPNNIIIDRIDKLNTSNVENMFMMFTGAFNSVETLNISNWDVSNVKDMFGMFAASLNSANKLDISNWNVSNVEDMTGMFLYSLNSLSRFDISNWNVSNNEYMLASFALSLNNLDSFDISNWNTSNVKDMSATFALSLNNLERFDISNWNTSNVEGMTATFGGALNNLRNFNISNWNVSKVKSLSYMFVAGLQNVESIDLSKFDTSSLKYMYGMFRDSLLNVKSLNISNWDVSNVVEAGELFYDGLSNATYINLSNWNMPKLKNAYRMFYSSFNNEKLDLYINKLELNNIEDLNGIFENMSANAIIYVKNQNQKDIILNLSNYNRPDSWNDANIIIA